MKKTYFTNLPISQMFGVPKTSETKKLPTLGAPKSWCVRSFRCRPALATLSASFSAFTWCTFREFFVRSETLEGEGNRQRMKNQGVILWHQPKPSKNCVGGFAWSLIFARWVSDFSWSKWKWKFVKSPANTSTKMGLPVVAYLAYCQWRSFHGKKTPIGNMKYLDVARNLVKG